MSRFGWMVGRSQSGPPAIGMAKPQSGPATTLTVQTQKQIATNSMPPGIREVRILSALCMVDVCLFGYETHCS